MNNKCDICGKFTKESRLVSMQGEGDEIWNECVDCMSQSDFERYYSSQIFSELEHAFIRLYERSDKKNRDYNQNEIYNNLRTKLKDRTVV